MSMKRPHKELGSRHFYPYKKKKLNKLKIGDLDPSVVVGQIPSRNREEQVNLDSHSQDVLSCRGAINWRNDINSVFAYSQEAKWSSSWDWETLEHNSFRGGGLTLLWLLPLEQHLGLTGKSRERSFPDSGKERRKVTTVKYSQSILWNKGLLSRGNDFSRILYHLGEGHLTQALPSFPVSPKVGGTKLRNTGKGHSTATQAHQKTET